MSDEEYCYSHDGDDNDQEEDEEEVFNMNNTSSALSSSSPSLHSFTCFSREKLHSNQAHKIAELQEVLNLNYFTVQRILMHFQWNAELVLNTLMDKMDNDVNVLLQTCGLLPSKSTSRMEQNGSSPETTTCSTFVCLICFESQTLEKRWTNGNCGHAFCSECWQSHVESLVQEGRMRKLACAGCDVLVHPELLCRILPEPMLKKYNEKMLDSFVEDQPNRAMWCPRLPTCGRAILITSSSDVDVECLCEESEVYCFSCKLPSHVPVNCQWAQRWREKCQSESENVTYILATCRMCPKCHVPIEKGDGCNHVTCKCGQCMCWLCGAATGRAHTYSGIEGHSCAGYQTNQEMKEKSQAKEALDVYIHYFDKYRVHMQSLEMARQKEAEVLQSMAVLERKEDELVDWLWIGLKQLFRMRRFLAWSYVFGYYAFFAFPGVSGEVKALQVLFETLQNRLQNNVEDLSLLVEGRPENMTMDTKPRVLSLCHNTHQQASNFFVFMEKEIVRRLPRNGGAGPSHEYFPIHKLVVGLGAKPLTADLDLDEEEDVVKEEMAEAGVVKKLKKKAQRWFS